MASGYSAFGNTGPCYRFYVAFRECRMNAGHPKICKLEMADYEECLHRRKLKQRVANKLIEVQRQAEEAKAPSTGSHH